MKVLRTKEEIRQTLEKNPYVFLTRANKAGTGWKIYTIVDGRPAEIQLYDHPYWVGHRGYYHIKIYGSDPIFELVYNLSHLVFGDGYKIRNYEVL